MSSKLEIEDQKAILVIDYFLNNHNNAVKNIAAELKLSEITVHKIINNHLKAATINGKH